MMPTDDRTRLTDEIEQVDALCPCRIRYKCSGGDDHVCTGPHDIGCECEGYAQHFKDATPCEWSGHELARRIEVMVREDVEEAIRRTIELGEEYAAEIRSDWSNFDGRDLMRHDMPRILAPIKTILRADGEGGDV